MLARDVVIEGFDVSDWGALLGVIGAASRRSKRTRRGGVVVLTEGGRTVKVLSTVHGRLEPDPASASASPVELAALHEASFVLRLDRTRLPELADRFAASIVREDEYLDQLVKLLGAARDLAREGAVELYTDQEATFTTVSNLAERAVDAVCPVGKTLFLGVFERDALLTSVGLHRGRRGFDRIVGPANLRAEVGLRSGDWARDAAGVARAAEMAIGALSLGCFAQRKTLEGLLAGDAPGAWAAAAAAREIVFQPLAPAVVIPLGLDAGRAALALARDIAVRIGADAFIRDLVNGAGSAWRRPS
jgi:hypothetical protein